MTTQPPPNHPPIDWSNWQPAGQNDVRSPCPMLNALANHSILPHSGRSITFSHAVSALTTSINLSPAIASLFTSVALTSNPNPNSNPNSNHAAHTFDLDHLDKHGLIEHDVSLSRGDVAFGDNHSFDPEVWGKVMERYVAGGEGETSFESVSRARYERVMKCKGEHEEAKEAFGYGVKEFLLSYGESALFLGILGSPDEGKVPLEYLRVLFQEERLPYNEGWRPNATPLSQTQMNHLIFSLIKANAHKAAEAEEVGLGTVHEVEDAVTSLLPSYCVVM